MNDFMPVEKLLSETVSKPSDRFASNLRNRAMQSYDHFYHPVHHKSLKINRTMRWATALALILTISLAFTPPGRALAQKILQFGLFILTNEPTSAEQMLSATPEIVYTPLVKNADLSKASELAGFPVYYPTFLPDGYVSSDPNSPIEVLFNSSGAVLKVDAMFEQASNSKVLSFSQIHFDPADDVSSLDFGTGQVEPQFVTVAGNEGVWLQDFIWGTGLDENGNQVPVTYNLLIWEITTEDGDRFQFWLGSEERLPLNVMLKIAESLTR
jgi:hypothetical protein